MGTHLWSLKSNLQKTKLFVEFHPYRLNLGLLLTPLLKMKYVAAYLLAALNGEAPSKSSVKAILESIGADINNEQFDKVFSELDGKNVDDVVSEGMGLLASVPSGGGAAAAGGATAAAAGGDAAEAAEEKKEESEESDSDMGFDLFG